MCIPSRRGVVASTVEAFVASLRLAFVVLDDSKVRFLPSRLSKTDRRRHLGASVSSSGVDGRFGVPRGGVGGVLASSDGASRRSRLRLLWLPCSAGPYLDGGLLRASTLGVASIWHRGSAWIDAFYFRVGCFRQRRRRGYGASRWRLVSRADFLPPLFEDFCVYYLSV